MVGRRSRKKARMGGYEHVMTFGPEEAEDALAIYDDFGRHHLHEAMAIIEDCTPNDMELERRFDMARLLTLYTIVIFRGGHDITTVNWRAMIETGRLEDMRSLLDIYDHYQEHRMGLREYGDCV